MNKKEKFRDQLLSQDKTNPDYQKTFQLEAKKMYTEKLKTSQRIAHVLVCFLISIFTLFFWAMAKVFEELQIKHEFSNAEALRLTSTWAMFLCILLIALSLWPAIRGKIGLRFYPKVIRFVFWVLILVIAALFCSTLEFLDKTEAINPTLTAWVFTIMTLAIIVGFYMLLSGRIDCGDLKNKAKTLELEYRITELEEKLKQDK